MYELRTYNRSGLNCAPKYEPVVHFGYQIYMTVVLLVIPLVLMTVLYGSVISSLRSGLKMDIAAIEIAENSMDRLDSARTTTNKSRSSSLVTTKCRRPRTPLIPFRGEDSLAGDTSSRKGSGFIEQSLRSTHSTRTAIAKQRLIRMLIVIVIIFFCCWTPSYIWWLLLNAQDSFGTFNVWNSKLNTFITVLTYLSSCTNPITYCFLNSKFRTALFLSFGCKRSVLRTRFQRVYAPGGNSASNQFYRHGNYTPSGNVSFREPESNSDEGNLKQIKQTKSLTFNVFNRLRSVINRKEYTEVPRSLDSRSFTEGRRSITPRNGSINIINNNNRNGEILKTEKHNNNMEKNNLENVIERETENNNDISVNNNDEDDMSSIDININSNLNNNMQNDTDDVNINISDDNDDMNIPDDINDIVTKNGIKIHINSDTDNDRSSESSPRSSLTSNKESNF